MKKQFLALTTTFVFCLSSASVFAEDTNAVTAESLLKAQQEHLLNATSTSLDLSMTLDGAVEISDGTSSSSIGMVMDGNFAVDMLMKPMQMAMDGTFHISLMGTEESMNMEMYMVESEDGKKLDTYQSVSDGSSESGWIRTQVDFEEMLETFGVTSFQELQTKSFDEFVPEGAEVNWNVEETDENYLLSTSFKFSDWMDLIESSMKAQGEEVSPEELAMIKPLMEGFTINASYTLNKETCAAESFHVDFNDSDLTALNTLISEMLASAPAEEGAEASNTTFSLTLNDFSIDGTYTYDTVTEITIPADALTAEVVDADDLDDVMDDLD